MEQYAHECPCDYSDEAFRFYQEAYAACKAECDKHPDDETCMKKLATVSSCLSRLYVYHEDSEKAIMIAEEALKIRRDLCATYPADTVLKRDLSNLYGCAAYAYDHSADPDEMAIQHYTEQIRLHRELCANDPANHIFRAELVEAYVNAAEVYGMEGGDDVVELYNNLIHFLTELLADHPDHQFIQADLAVANTYQAELYNEWHVQDEADKYYRESLRLYRELYANDSNEEYLAHIEELQRILDNNE